MATQTNVHIHAENRARRINSAETSAASVLQIVIGDADVQFFFHRGGEEGEDVDAFIERVANEITQAAVLLGRKAAQRRTEREFAAKRAAERTS